MRRLITIAVAFLLATTLYAQRQFFVDDSVSVTTSNTSVSFTDNGSGGSSAAFRARHVTVESSGASANTCHFDLKDTTATTADIPLEPGGGWTWHYQDGPGESPGQGGWEGLGAICGTGTATFVVTASR
jgi:hypothetical protein